MDVQLNLAGKVLTIRGEKKNEREEKDQDYTSSNATLARSAGRRRESRQHQRGEWRAFCTEGRPAAATSPRRGSGEKRPSWS
jgi:hypothetical protein